MRLAWLISTDCSIGRPRWRLSRLVRPWRRSALAIPARGFVGAVGIFQCRPRRVCTATFKSDPTPLGFKVEFDANCGNFFPLVLRWSPGDFQKATICSCLMPTAKRWSNSARLKAASMKRRRAGVGVLFLQQASAGTGPKPPEQVAGTWDVARGGNAVCTFALTNRVLRDGFRADHAARLRRRHCGAQLHAVAARSQ